VKKQPKKLSLSRETLRVLEDDLRLAAGGINGPAPTTPSACIKQKQYTWCICTDTCALTCFC
jgi:hypothetical protein